MKEYLENVRCVAPLIHNITNYVTANDVANVLLACGASPIMADEEAEVGEIFQRSKPWHLCVEHRKKIVEIWQCQIQWMWKKLLINQIIVEKLQV